MSLGTHLCSSVPRGISLTSCPSPAVCLVRTISGGSEAGARLPELPQSAPGRPEISSPCWNAVCPASSTSMIPRGFGMCPTTDSFLLEWAGLGNDCRGQSPPFRHLPLSAGASAELQGIGHRGQAQVQQSLRSPYPGPAPLPWPQHQGWSPGVPNFPWRYAW